MNIFYYALPFLLQKGEVFNYYNYMLESIFSSKVNLKINMLFSESILNDNSLIDFFNNYGKNPNINIDNIELLSSLEYNNCIYHCLNNGFSINNNINCKKIASIYTTLPLTDSEIIDPSFNLRYMEKINDNYYNNVKFIVPYVFMKEELSRFFNYDDSNIYVINPSINSSCIGKSKLLSNAYISNKFNINYKYYIFIGEINNRNDLIDTIKAFKIHADCFDVKLILILHYLNKDKNFLKELLKYIDRVNLNDKIVFLDELTIDDKLNLINASTCFIYLNKYDELNVSLLYAATLNTNILTYNTRPILEILDDIPIYIDNYSDITNLKFESLEFHEMNYENKSNILNLSEKISFNNSALEHLKIYNII